MVKERRVLKNGDIVAYPLEPYDSLFGYVRYVDLRVGNPLLDYHNPFRWIVYNYFTAELNFEIDYILSSDWLCNPLLMYWSKNIKDLLNWKIIGNRLPNDREYENRFVRYIPKEFFSTDPLNYSSLDWAYCEESNTDFNKGKWVKHPYDNLRHLEGSGSVLVSSLPSRAYLEKCKMNCKSIDVSKFSENEWYGAYMKCLDIPAYNIIPTEFRQKPIPINIEWNWPIESQLYFNYLDRPVG